MNKRKVLVVEDDPLIMESLVEMLEIKGYDVITAKNGFLGLASIKLSIPDIIISDVTMPEMDGFEFLKEIRSKPETEMIPIIMLTAKVELESKLHGLELGADDYITKPFEFRELHQKVVNLIKRHSKPKFPFGIHTENRSDSSQDLLFLKKLWVLLDGNIETPKLQVSFLATHLHMSPSTLQRKVKKIMGKPTVVVVKEFKLKKAHELVQMNYGTLSEIAFKCGFNSLAYFSSSYKEFFGRNPKEDLPK